MARRVALAGTVIVTALVLLGRLGAVAPASQLAIDDYGVIEPPPTMLADGTPVGAAPDVVEARVVEPVVVSDRRDAAPVACTAEAIGRATPNWRGLFDASAVVDVRVGVEALTAVRTGAAPSPPGWPSTYQATCVATWGGDRWDAAPWLIGHAFAVTGAWSQDAHPRHAFVAVPPGAAWALQARTGWWLAHDVAGTPRLGLTTATAADEEQPPLRLVFLDATGEVMQDMRIGADAFDVEAQIPPPAGRLSLGPEAPIRAALRRGPVRACTPSEGTCVWITAAEEGPESTGPMVAVAGWSALDAPPLSQVGWCPTSRTFEGLQSGRTYGPGGSATSETPSLLRFPVDVVDGSVTIDLGGGARPDAFSDMLARGERCVFPDGPLGLPGAVYDSLVASRDAGHDIAAVISSSVDGAIVEGRVQDGAVVVVPPPGQFITVTSPPGA